jgi:hypothetical protein
VKLVGGRLVRIGSTNVTHVIGRNMATRFMDMKL